MIGYGRIDYGCPGGVGERRDREMKQGSRKQIMAGRNMWRRKWREECCGKWREVAGGESLPTRGRYRSGEI